MEAASPGAYSWCMGTSDLATVQAHARGKTPPAAWRVGKKSSLEPQATPQKGEAIPRNVWAIFIYGCLRVQSPKESEWRCGALYDQLNSW